LSVEAVQASETLSGPVPVTFRPLGVEGGVVSAGTPWQGSLLIRQPVGAVTAPVVLTSKPTAAADAPGASGDAQLGEAIVYWVPEDVSVPFQALVTVSFAAARRSASSC
jgi:hypothetical protein